MRDCTESFAGGASLLFKFRPAGFSHMTIWPAQEDRKCGLVVPSCVLAASVDSGLLMPRFPSETLTGED